MQSPVTQSRRHFLRSSLLAGVAPLILPYWASAAAPGNRIQLGFIGVGLQGRGLMNNALNREGVRVVAVCDVDTRRREDSKARVDAHYRKQGATTGDCRAFEDFRELLSLKDLDGVVIATPDHWHALIAIAAAKAGKDIYCEKPLCKSVAEAKALVKAVRGHRCVFQVGSMQRSMREFRVACELVRNGLLGKIDHVDVTVGGPAVPCDLSEEPAEPGLNWDLWLGPAPWRPYNSILSPRGVHNHFPNWRRYREYGGGAVTDFGAHHFDIAHWGLGLDRSGPEEIIAPSDWQTAQFGVRLRYRGGFEIVHAKVPGHNDITFYGKDGTVQVDRGRISVSIAGRTIEPGTGLAAQLDAIEREFLGNPKVRLYRSADHMGDWLAAMRSRQQPVCDVETGARTSTVCNLVNLAYYHGQSMKWNPSRETFTGGTGKKEWLDVTRRDPWKLS